MSARKLLETDVQLILKKIKTDIAGALADVRGDRLDPSVNTEPPAEYYIWPKFSQYRSPAVYVIAEGMTFNKAEKGSNFVTALSRINVGVVIEERTAEKLTIKAFRYLAALHEVLDQEVLQSDDNKVKLFIRVARAENSELETKTDDRDNSQSVFRKEVALFCEVEHFENY